MEDAVLLLMYVFGYGLLASIVSLLVMGTIMLIHNKSVKETGRYMYCLLIGEEDL